ncbi:hypothetical protein V8359_16120 [Roseovarius sp. E0-M6]
MHEVRGRLRWNRNARKAHNEFDRAKVLPLRKRADFGHGNLKSDAPRLLGSKTASTGCALSVALQIQGLGG